jgi:translocation and assembly module TamB
MSDPESTPSLPAETPEPAAPPEAPRPSRLRRFFLLHLPLGVAGVAILMAAAAVGLYFAASSASFENFVRRQMVNNLESATGGRVEIASFHWRLLNLEAEADGLVIHGLEAPGEAPYAQADHVRARFSVLGFFSPRILLRDLEISRPQLHLIVYADGSTNQPQPRKRRKPGKPALDTFFALKAGHIEVEQGILDYENRAAAFDFQDRFIPLDFAANDLSLSMTYIPAALSFRLPSSARLGSQESYRIEAGVRDLSLTRGPSSKSGKAQPVEGFLQATLDLTRTDLTLRSLRLTAHSHGIKDRTLEISGSLHDFAHPRWQAKATGELDMRLLDPITGYPFAPEGIAHLDLNGSGQAGSFRADGSVHVEDGAYIGTGVIATGVGLDAHLHADPDQLLITSIVARLHQGGQIDGDLSLVHWLPTLPAASTPHPASAANGKSGSVRIQPTPPAAHPTRPAFRRDHHSRQRQGDGSIQGCCPGHVAGDGL